MWGDLPRPRLYAAICGAVGLQPRRLVARGGFAHILAAEVRGRPVALKVAAGGPGDEALAHLEAERRALSSWIGAAAHTSLELLVPEADEARPPAAGGPEHRVRVSSAVPTVACTVPPGVPALQASLLFDGGALRYHTLVLPLYSGPSLHDFLEALRPTGFFMSHEIVTTATILPDVLLWIATQMLASLQAVHAKGLVFVDVRPGNFIFHRTSKFPALLFVIDFGRAAPAGSIPSGEADSHATRPFSSPWSSIHYDRGGPWLARDDLLAMALLLMELAGCYQGVWLWDADLVVAHKEEALDCVLQGRAGVPPGLGRFIEFVLRLADHQPVDYEYAAACLQYHQRALPELSAQLDGLGFPPG